MTAAETSPATTRPGEPMLQIDDIALYYGKIAAVKGVSLRVHKGEIVTLIGSNGAGKSTTLRAISGLIRPRTGHDLLPGPEAQRRRRATRSSSAASASRPRAGASSRA